MEKSSVRDWYQINAPSAFRRRQFAPSGSTTGTAFSGFCYHLAAKKNSSEGLLYRHHQTSWREQRATGAIGHPQSSHNGFVPKTGCQRKGNTTYTYPLLHLPWWALLLWAYRRQIETTHWHAYIGIGIHWHKCQYIGIHALAPAPACLVQLKSQTPVKKNL